MDNKNLLDSGKVLAVSTLRPESDLQIHIKKKKKTGTVECYNPNARDLGTDNPGDSLASSLA